MSWQYECGCKGKEIGDLQQLNTTIFTALAELRLDTSPEALAIQKRLEDAKCQVANLEALLTRRVVELEKRRRGYEAFNVARQDIVDWFNAFENQLSHFSLVPLMPESLKEELAAVTHLSKEWEAFRSKLQEACTLREDYEATLQGSLHKEPGSLLGNYGITI